MSSFESYECTYILTFRRYIIIYIDCLSIDWLLLYLWKVSSDLFQSAVWDLSSLFSFESCFLFPIIRLDGPWNEQIGSLELSTIDSERSWSWVCIYLIVFYLSTILNSFFFNIRWLVQYKWNCSQYTIDWIIINEDIFFIFQYTFCR